PARIPLVVVPVAPGQLLPLPDVLLITAVLGDVEHAALGDRVLAHERLARRDGARKLHPEEGLPDEALGAQQRERTLCQHAPDEVRALGSPEKSFEWRRGAEIGMRILALLA